MDVQMHELLHGQTCRETEADRDRHKQTERLASRYRLPEHGSES